MIETRLQLGKDTLIAQSELLRDTAGRFQEAVQREVVPQVKQRALFVLRATPGTPRYPLRWASDRQRKAVMAKLRRENNLPYKRTGNLVRSWQIDDAITISGGAITANNDVDYAGYVIGDRQQPFHSDTGWYVADNVLGSVRVYAQNLLIDTWSQVTTEDD